MAAFIGTTSLRGAQVSRRERATVPRMCASPEDDAGKKAEITSTSPPLSRRDVLQWMTLASVLGGNAPLLVAPQSTSARVAFDIDRYGDKEMKVSTVNRVKQNLRDAIGKNPKLTASFVLLTALDALSYNASDGLGGPNGSIRFEADRPENAGILPAINAIKSLKDKQKDVSYADFYSFGGAVALEVTNGPRVVVQIGREDADKRSDSEKSAYENLTASSRLDAIRAALRRAGRDDAKEAVLLLGALRALQQLGEQKGSQGSIEDEADPYSEDVFGEGGYLSYGEISKTKRGPVLVDSTTSSLVLRGSKFDNSYFKALLQAEKKDPKSLTEVDRQLLGDEACRRYVEKYSSDSRGFVNNFADMLEALTLLGSNYESGKIRAD